MSGELVVGIVIGVAIATAMFAAAGLVVWWLERAADRAEKATKTRFTKRWELEG